MIKFAGANGGPQGFGLSGGFLEGLIDVALFAHPDDLSVDKRGNIYVADTNNARIRMITPAGQVPTIVAAVESLGIEVDRQRDILYISDSPRHQIWAVDLPV